MSAYHSAIFLNTVLPLFPFVAGRYGTLEIKELYFHNYQSTMSNRKEEFKAALKMAELKMRVIKKSTWRSGEAIKESSGGRGE